MHKAKSRLQASEETSDQGIEKVNHRPSATGKRLAARYLKQLPTLIMSLPFGAAVIYIITRIYPDRIANFLIPNSYFLILLPFFLFVFWFLSFVFLNARRGFFLSLLLTLYLFLRLQSVIFTWEVVLYPLILSAIVELCCSYFSYRNR